MIDKQLAKWIKQLTKDLELMDKRQAIFNGALVSLLNEAQQVLLNKMLDELSNKVVPTPEEIKAYLDNLEKITKDKEDE